MLWSPNEVLAYVRDDLGFPKVEVENGQLNNTGPTVPFGGFRIWPLLKEDFILIAENSEIHGPNPLFIIPEQDPSIDLNALSTQILSADYQGLGNNKALPTSNAQLVMPDLATDLHAAITYFFLFDSEARGFVRPTCIAYFTADKHKLIKLAKSLLNTLNEAAAILQHSNIIHHSSDLKMLRDSIQSTIVDTENSVTKGNVIENRLKDIQTILDRAESYKGNEFYDKQIATLLENLKTNANSEKIKNFDSSFSTSIKGSSSKTVPFRPNAKKFMKNLYLICKSGLILALYHLYIMHKYFRRKYETIIVAENFNDSDGSTLYFGACMKSSICCSDGSLEEEKCHLKSFSVPSTVSLENTNYFDYLDNTFENILLNFIKWRQDYFETTHSQQTVQTHSPKSSAHNSSDPSLFQSSSSYSHSFNRTENNMKIKDHITKCRHIVPLNMIWDTLNHIIAENPGIEASFLNVLKLFDDTQKLLFAMLTQVPIVVISTRQELQTAQSFIKALSVFIPRRKEEDLYVEFNRQLSLEREQLPKLAAVNFCLSNQVIEDLIPLELLSSLCILNLKDCSLTGPRYFGCLLAKVDQQIRVLSSNGPVFAVLVSILLKIEQTINWWQMLISSSADNSTVSKYVLAKGYNRSDMHIIEKLSRLCRS